MLYTATLTFSIDWQDKGTRPTDEQLLSEAKRKLVVMGFTRRWPGLRVDGYPNEYFERERSVPPVLDAVLIAQSKPTFEPKLHAARKRKKVRRRK